MEGLDKRLRLLSKNTRNIFEHGIKSLWNRTSEYVEAGIDRTREYLETASKYVTNTGNRIREKVEIAKEVMQYALMNILISNRWGQMGYIGSKAFISYKMAKQAEKGKMYYGRSNVIVPLIVGSITGALGLGIGILLGDFNSLIHQNHDLEQLQNLEEKYEQLQQQYQNVENQYQQELQEVQYLQKQNLYLQNQYQQELQEVQYLQNQIQNLNNQLKYLSNQDQQLLKEVQYLQNQNQYLQIQDQQLQQEVKSLEKQIQYLNNLDQQLQQEVKSLEQQLQSAEILFGNGNSDDISVIQVNSVQIVNGYAVVNGNVYSTGENVTLGIPISYVENNATNIQEFVNNIQQDGWNAYIVIDRADLQYMSQSGWVISIQPNEPINIAVVASPANSSTLDNVLNQLTNYNIVIQDGNQGNYAVYGDPNAFYGYLPSVTSSTGGTVVINFPEGSPYYSEAENMINIADQIINSSNNPNPTNSGAIYTYDIFNATSVGVYNNTSEYFPEYNVGQTYIPLIVLKSGQGNTIINEVSS